MWDIIAIISGFLDWPAAKTQQRFVDVNFEIAN